MALKNQKHQRSVARRMALQVLYTGEIKAASPTQIAESGEFPAEEGLLSDYALVLIRGVESHQTAINHQLMGAAENWSIMRMPIVDRCILRLAVFEMMFVDDVPTSVAINEAVELAKDFGGEDDSPRFVNGVLGRIAKDLDAAQAQKAPAAAPAQDISL